jgi:hypothetical protein
MIDELERMRKEAVVFYFKALFRHSPRGTEEDQERTQDSPCPGRDLNQELLKYKSEAYRLIQLRLYKYFKTVYQFIGLLYPEGRMRR